MNKLPVMQIFNDYLPKFILDYLFDKRRNQVWNKAYDLEKEKKYAEAAGVYARFAPELLAQNELAYCTFCEYAFEMYVKAKEPAKALEQAQNILRVLSEKGWLKYSAGEKAEIPLKMVPVLRGAGYHREADLLTKEVNRELEKHELPPRGKIAPQTKNKFPSSCRNCGASLPFSPYREVIKCSYCKAVIYPE